MPGDAPHPWIERALLAVTILVLVVVALVR
jgi:hypothetical protein